MKNGESHARARSSSSFTRPSWLHAIIRFLQSPSGSAYSAEGLILTNIDAMLVMRFRNSLTQQGFARWMQRAALAVLLLVWGSPAISSARSIRDDPKLKALFEAVGRMHNIDPYLLEAIAEVESGGNALSISSKGALGLMQLMPGTASAFSVLDPFNPVANVMGAADFIDYLTSRFASNLRLQGLPNLLAAYNAGPGAVEKYGGIPPYPETRQYVQRVISRYTNSIDGPSAVNDQAAAAPVLILGPMPYLIRVAPDGAMQPEPVLISVDGDQSVLTRLKALERVHGYSVAAVGSAPDLRLNRVGAGENAESSHRRGVQTHDQSQLTDSQYLR
jgi:soluble lytic murein transglycosylase-like protein